MDLRVPPWVTPTLAIWGAALSTLVFVRDWWRHRVRVAVLLRYGPPPPGVRTGNTDPAAFPLGLAATVINKGREPVHLAKVAFEAEGGLRMSFPPLSTEPALGELRPGQSFISFLPAETAWTLSEYSEHRRLRAIVTDQVGRRYFSSYAATGPVEKTPTGWSLRPVSSPRSRLRRAWLRARALADAERPARTRM